MNLNPSHITEIAAAAIFVVALLHTFSTKFFEDLARRSPRHGGIWHLLAEVEVVFGFWALVLMLFMFAYQGKQEATTYLETRNFTEPMFVFAIMVIAGTRPIIQSAMRLVRGVAKALPLPGSVGMYFLVMSLVPLLGSFITEPAAMTLAALILADQFFGRGISTRLKYATLGVLFVNISIGGTLTSFAAPPVLMVASKWGWDSSFMLAHFGWKAAIAVFINTLGVTLLFAKELKNLPMAVVEQGETAKVPLPLVLVHMGFLAGVVVFAHHPAVFMGLFLFFLGVASAYERHQDRLILREGLLVAFFLAGLVVLGGLQQWWLQPVLMSMSSDAIFFGATVLTAFTDNAALTYLGSLVEGLSDGFKYALVAGAVTGGGLTIIANAPNPAGIAVLREHFDGKAVHPLGLLLAALLPTLVAALAFKLL
ncbi:Na+/H+ antiporter NhaD/arsenite permease-like protein [Paucibacter oligotrophus]|uniref:Na+/H+ antiporter NhaD/arsenite permease-like protein n=1 Tax=Roseateles oligotrophus TaxID=1769250 RepID=A0A840L4R5_9BURK|nr:putative Na+/H+ antiporter [Roseateles oligotrophus]MBB4841682.1 Na+/H+ antiporter NhaD/arsenite permease-like protein [Roseateles oligotrophus]